MPSKRIIAYIERNAHLGYSVKQIRTELLKEGFDRKEIEEALKFCYKKSSHFSVLRFPLIFLIIGMPIVLLLMLSVAKNLFLGDAWYFVIFAAYPAAIAIYLGYKCAKENIPEAQSLLYELIIGFLAGIIAYIFVILYLKPMNHELFTIAIMIFTISCFTAIFVTLLTRYILKEHIAPGVEKPLLNYKKKFNLEKFFMLNGDVRMSVFLACILFLGIYIGIIWQAVAFIVALIIAFTLIGHCYETKNEVMAVFTSIALFGFIGIYSWPFFILMGLALLRATLYYLKTHKRHNFFALFGVYIVIYVYLFSLFALAFLFFTYIIAPLLRPISMLYLALIFFVLMAILLPIPVYLLFTALKRTTGKIGFRSALWPFAYIIRPHKHKFSDSLRFGFGIGIILLIIACIVISIMGSVYSNNVYENMFEQRIESSKGLEINLQNILMDDKNNYQLPENFLLPDLLLNLQQKNELQRQKMMTFPISRPSSFFSSFKLFINGKVFEDWVLFIEQMSRTSNEYNNAKELMNVGAEELLMQHANNVDGVQFLDETSNLGDHIQEMQFRTEQLLKKIEPRLGMKDAEQSLTPEAVRSLLYGGRNIFQKNLGKFYDQTHFGTLFGKTFLANKNIRDLYSNANQIREFQKMTTRTNSEEAVRLKILLYLMGKEYAQQCDTEDNECFKLLPHFVTDINVCNHVQSRFCTETFEVVHPEYEKCTDDRFVQSIIKKC
ncbi:hypothetical protein KY336_01935 [Candidatus Woesearchaeota archaeon]|nr:hypothetical protein [Candidatus Woesearchaeota archaeon]